MSGVPFHATRMGARFYEGTMPDLVRELERLNRNLERALELIEPRDEAKVTTREDEEGPR